MKKVLIIVLSCDFPPYDVMIDTSLNTWDKVEVEGVETIFACGSSEKPDTEKVKFYQVGNGLFDMGKKNIASFEWALANKDFDYVARINASCYVDKKELIKYVQGLPSHSVFAGVEAKSIHGFAYAWGGTQFILSRDVIKRIVDNKNIWIHSYMEDESISLLVQQLGIPITHGIRSCSIDKKENGWRWQLLSYINRSKDFSYFNDIKDLGHVFYRVKQDGERWLDKLIMEELYKVLK